MAKAGNRVKITLRCSECKQRNYNTNITLVHKGNIMKFTEGGFKKWGYELAQREFGDALADGRLVIKDCIADAFLQNTLLIPEEYSIIATLNLNGDYVSDQLAAMVGGIGISGVGLELIALGCGVCYMLSGTHGLYSSQLFVTEKLLSEYTESWGARLKK